MSRVLMGCCSASRVSRCSEKPPCSALVQRKAGGKRVSQAVEAGAQVADLQNSDGGACTILYHCMRCDVKSKSTRSESAAGAKRPNGKRRRSKSVG